MKFDYLIVGGGTAGCVLAARLTEGTNLSVALLEAGGTDHDDAIADPAKWPFLQGTKWDWQFETTPQEHTDRRVHGYPRGKGLGGSTLINAMAHVRGHPSDFDAWAADGCTGWSFADLLPYFIRSEASSFAPSPYHGADGPVRLITPSVPHPITRCFMAAGANQGFPPTEEHNGARMAGPTLNTLTIADGKRQTIAAAYLAGARQRAGLTILADREVDALEFDGDNRCVGARAGSERFEATRGVILSAGAIGSPALLLRAGIGPADELREAGVNVRLDLPGVGRNLHDHLLSGGNVYRARLPVPPSKYQHSESLMYLGDPDQAPNLVLACVVLPVVTECFEAPPEGYTIMFGFTHPKSRGSVRLTAAVPDGPLAIDPNYLAHADDRREYLAALDAARAVGADTAFDEWRAAELLPGKDVRTEADKLAFLARAAFTHHHPVGTCRMGAREDAVVGADLAVRGISGLHVVDASVIPRITTGPVNAAVIAIAERASDLIAGRTPLPPRHLPAES